MAKIIPISFPGKIGIADKLNMRTSFNLEADVATLNYQFVDSSTEKMISHNSIIIPQNIYLAWGADNQYIIDWLINELGVELIKQD